MFNILCAKGKSGNQWCFDFALAPTLKFKGELLAPQVGELIHAILLDKYHKIPEKISVTFDCLSLPSPDVILKLMIIGENEFVYVPTRILNWQRGFNKLIRLGPGLTCFFRVPPDQLYFYITKEE